MDSAFWEQLELLGRMYDPPKSEWDLMVELAVIRAEGEGNDRKPSSSDL